MNAPSMKDAKTMREQASRLAHLYASQRAADGDPEGAEVIKDLARAIKRLPLK